MLSWRNFCCRWIQSILHSFNPWKISVNWIDKSKSRSNETVTRHSARYKLQKITLSRSTLIFLSNFNASTRHYIEIVSFLCNKLIKCHLSSYDTVFCAFHWTGEISISMMSYLYSLKILKSTWAPQRQIVIYTKY